jgi:hypothetical protein
LKQNLHAIQLALERYAVDHDGCYPLTIADLKRTDYLPRLPRNAYLESHEWRSRYSNEQLEMINLAESNSFANRPLVISGNFIYLPELEGGGEGPQARAYVLQALGTESHRLGWQRRAEPARIILELGSGLNKKVTSPHAPY